jgi:type II secretory pathway pseudopilin PulG
MSRKPRAFTLVEVVMVVALSAMVTIPILVTMDFVMRAQATAANQAMVRLRSDNVLDQLIQDIQNTSRGRYNATPLNRLAYFGTGAAANSWRVTLLDTVVGARILWTFDAATGRFSRRFEQYTDSATPLITNQTFDQRFADFRIQETIRSDFEVVTATGTVDNETITGLRLWGRAFLTLKPKHTTFQEVDANNDGDYRNDQVGTQLFGRVFRGDDPRWQYIFNVSGTFRNT